MTSSRIKDPSLGDRVDENEIAWLRFVMPITERYRREIEQRDYKSPQLAHHHHYYPPISAHMR